MSVYILTHTFTCTHPHVYLYIYQSVYIFKTINLYDVPDSNPLLWSSSGLYLELLSPMGRNLVFIIYSTFTYLFDSYIPIVISELLTHTPVRHIFTTRQQHLYAILLVSSTDIGYQSYPGQFFSCLPPSVLLVIHV